MRKTLLLTIFLITSLTLSSQDLSGIWQGVLYQFNPTGTYYFVYTVTFRQTGNAVTGTSYATAYGTPYYANYITTGTVNNNILSFKDIEKTDSKAPEGSDWCIKYGDLTFDPAIEKLSGVGNGFGNCPSFDIELYRLTIRADTNHCAPKTVPIQATGQNLKWYADKDKITKLGSGNLFIPFVSQTTTYYVTQTIYDTESPVVPYTIHINATSNKTQTLKICEGKSVLVGDTVYRITGNYSKLLKTSLGCDSIINTNLTVNLNKKTNQSFKICDGQTVIVGDTTYRTIGNYIKILRTTEGCDSTVTTNLTINNPIQKTQDVTLCDGQSITVGDTIYRTTGKYIKKYTAFSGCDSILITNIKVNAAVSKTQNVSLCEGQSVTVGDTIYRTSGKYIKKLTSFTGCDSVVTTTVTIKSAIEKVQNLTICEGQSVTVGDTTYRTSGSYIKRLKSSSTCDSIVKTNLEITQLDITIPITQTIRLGDSIFLDPKTNWANPLAWKWTPNVNINCDTCQSVWAKPKTTTTYSVEATDRDSKCKSTNKINVIVKKQCNIFIPNAFSPNGDNENEVFTIYFENCIKSIREIGIYSRWGNPITNQKNIPTTNINQLTIWDGRVGTQIMTNETYVYFIEVEYLDGSFEVLKGDVNVIR
jgi:gliding motility-associated-like protein